MSLVSLSKVEKSTNLISPRALITTFNYLISYKSYCWFILNGHNFAQKHGGDPQTETFISTLLVHKQQNLYPNNPFILNKIISFCSKSNLYDLGIQLHSTVVKLGLTSNVYICSALLDFYGNCGCIGNAQDLFDEMPQRNVVSWNSLISGYVQGGYPEMGIGLFLRMLGSGTMATAFGVSVALIGCAQMEASGFGAQVHGLSLTCGVWSNVVVGTGLVDMYSKCWNLEDSRRVFDMMDEKNGVTWTAMVAGYVHHNLPYEAMALFREMQRLAIESSYVTCNSLLSSFSGGEHLDHCKQIHCYIIGKGFKSNEYIQISLVTAYAECECGLKEFEKVSLIIMKWSQISWNALISGFCHLECSDKALECFFNMRRIGVASDFVTLTSVLRAIGLISALDAGKQVHALAFKIGSTFNLHVQNGLVSMYGRCGLINDSKRVFLELKEPDLISWNSLLAGYSHHGKGQQVIDLFEEMRGIGIKPDINTFISVLSACSHARLVEKGLAYFELVRKLDPCEHLPMELYASMVDMLGRAGFVHEAEVFVNSMPIQPGPSVYKSLLSSCRVHGNAEVGARVSSKFFEQCPHDTAAYVLLSNSLTTQGCWDEAREIRKLMHQRKMGKGPGQSWI